PDHPHQSSLLRHPQDLLKGGDALQRLADAVLVHGEHAFLAGFLLDHAHVGVLHDQAANGVGHHQELHDGGTTVVAGGALGAGLGSPQPDRALVGVLVQLEFGDHFGHRLIRLSRLRVQAPHQSLREDAVDGGGQQVVGHAHVEQAGDAAGGAVGMQRRQHQVTGQRRLDGDLGGFAVAHFADHDHIRILTHDGAQRAGEVEADLRLGLDLVDALDLVLDRVLDGDDLHVRRVDLRQRRIQRGGLARTGGAGDQQDAVRALQHVDEATEELVGETQRLEVEYNRFAVEDTHHHRLTVRGRHGGYAQVQLLALHADHDAAVLRQAAL